MVIYQLIFLTFLYLVGSLFMWSIFPQLKPIDKQLLSPFVGIGFSAIGVGALLILQVSLSLISFFVSLLIIIIGIKLFFSKMVTSYFPSKLSIKDFVFNAISIPFILYVIISLSFLKIGYGDASPDSTGFEGVGRYLEQGGVLKSNVHELPFILNGRLLIVGSMHAINRMFHGYNLYALNPTMCFWLLIFMSYTIFKMNKALDISKRLSILLFFLITLGLYKRYFSGMFDIHNNQLAMVYFTLAFLSLYLFSVLNDRVWIYIGSLTIAFACLTRIDMLIGSLIYFFLLGVNDKVNYKILISSYCIFIIVCLPWRIFTVYHTPWNTWYVNFPQISALLGANIICCLIFVFAYRKQKFISSFKKLPIIGMPLVMVIVFLCYPDRFTLAWNLFFKYILLGHNTWLSIVASLLFSAAAFRYISHYDKDYYILFSPTVIYLFLLFLMVAVSGREGEDHSADRMVLHTVPLFVYSLFIGFSTAITHKPKPSRGVFGLHTKKLAQS